MINWHRVNELKHEIGEDDFAEVAELFLEEFDEVICRLKSTPKPEQFEADMHFLKGSAMNLGFDALSHLCSTGEREAALGNFDAVPLSAVFETYETSKTDFLAAA
jgi:HPt (histidine-containing phosphotransfer) domain-containing protein